MKPENREYRMKVLTKAYVAKGDPTHPIVLKSVACARLSRYRLKGGRADGNGEGEESDDCSVVRSAS